jgi:energy-coupling factor transport system substrate-specific component
LERLLEIPKKLQVVYKDHDLTLGTAKICRSMSAVLGLTAEDRNLLYLTALAHDCGYLIIDHDRLARIIAKKEIDEEEFAFLKTHVAAGIEYFQGIELPEQFRGGIMYHHERNDGSGYPEGLKKEEIPVFAKIIGIAETFATLTTNRPYRNKWGVEQALSIISDGARSKFDAEHVAALVKVAASMGEGR